MEIGYHGHVGSEGQGAVVFPIRSEIFDRTVTNYIITDFRIAFVYPYSAISFLSISNLWHCHETDGSFFLLRNSGGYF